MTLIYYSMHFVIFQVLSDVQEAVPRPERLQMSFNE